MKKLVRGSDSFQMIYLNCAGGLDGMGKLVNDKELFNSLNIGMALDEGLANETNRFTVFNGERGIWWLKVRL